MNDSKLTEKLLRLVESANSAERFSLALELCDTRDPRVFETVVKFIQRHGLRPIMKVEVVSPEECLGDVIAGLNSRRGQIQSTDTRRDAQVVVAMVPLANLFGYTDELRSFRPGSAQYTMLFSHYDEVSDDGGPPDTEPAAAALRA